MSDNVLPLPSDPRLTQAARWRVLLTEAGLQTSPAFELWHEDPQNRAAWEQVNAPWDFFAGVAHEPEVMAARQAALGDAFRVADHAVSPLRRLLQVAALLLAIGLTAAGGVWWTNLPDHYETAHGERRVVTLKDGSRISLDANSLVTVRYLSNARMLELRRGQARFDVARDKERPFSVIAGDQKVVATGTAFNIDMAGPKVLVTLIEGHVLVYGQRGQNTELTQVDSTPQIELKAGEQLAVAPAVPPMVVPVNIQRVTAWTSGQIIFESEPLSSVVERVNRYGVTRIEISDAAVANMKISGVFNAGDVAGAVDIVTQYLPVRAVPLDGGRVLLEAKPVADTTL